MMTEFGCYFCCCESVPCESVPPGEGIVGLYDAPNPFLLNKICLNQSVPWPCLLSYESGDFTQCQNDFCSGTFLENFMFRPDFNLVAENNHSLQNAIAKATFCTLNVKSSLHKS